MKKLATKNKKSAGKSKFPTVTAAAVVRKVEKAIGKKTKHAKAVDPITFPSKSEAKLIVENQKLRKKVRTLQQEVKDLNYTIKNGTIYVETLKQKIEELTPKQEATPAPAPVSFSPPPLNDDAGPTVPATVAST